MSEERMDRMEEMLSSLITLVGKMNQQLQNSLEEQASFREKQTTMYEEQQEMHQELQEVKKEQTIMHEKITGISDKLTGMQVDQDYIWEKGARNERELARLKKQLQL